MTKRMLIDATHAEETRVVVLDGNRLEDFDVETQSRKQLKGNIYLAKVVRVEPSLQAAFVEYGGNRHGFLAFGEIHPDYYQIPVADRQRLIQMQEEEARAEAEEDDDPLPESAQDRIDAENAHALDAATAQPLQIEREVLHAAAVGEADGEASGESAAGGEASYADPFEEPTPGDDAMHTGPGGATPDGGEATAAFAAEAADLGTDIAPEAAEPAQPHAPLAADDAAADDEDTASEAAASREHNDEETNLGSRVQEVPMSDQPLPETIGGEHDSGDEVRERRPPPRFTRNYKIQEVIRRRQILLIQVVKEERGTKGAALTTYISLAGRYCVLMPNSPRGGGISRKITSATDRRRLKEVTAELEIPRGMGLIVRTAGANRPKPEIKRDCEYLLRLWDDIREHTLRSVAPALIYEEASLIKRAIRDVYSRDVDEVLVDGEDGWKAARDFMRMLMPTHVKKVQLWRDGGVPLFVRNQVEAQLDAMLQPTVQLRSGGYLVINQAEALVAIDVNSGRSTRERGIEETALRTNLEAADEVARQLRLRDLAGLIVIDFIDMEAKKHNAAVERRLKDALKSDRARIQVGHISHFGLMEMSRQRLRPSIAETSLNVCAACGGTGHVRSNESAALHVLRALEEEGSKRRAAEILVHVASATALYILNHKRQRLTDIELRHGMKIGFAADETLLPAQTRIERLRAQTAAELPPPVTASQARFDAADIEADEADSEADADDQIYTGIDGDDVPVAGETAEEGERRRKRRRRRRRGGRRDDASAPASADATPMPDGADQPVVEIEAFPGARPVEWRAPPPAAEPDLAADPAGGASVDVASEPSPDESTRGPRRRGRGRRKRPEDANPQQDAPPLPYAGPTPADPFGGGTLDIFDVLEQAEAQHYAPPAPQPEPVDADYAEPAAEISQAPAELTAEVVAPVANGPEREPQPAGDKAVVEPLVGPAIKPVVIGAGETVTEKKRGWWKK
jgi:ribonuclease E